MLLNVGLKREEFFLKFEKSSYKNCKILWNKRKHPECFEIFPNSDTNEFESKSKLLLKKAAAYM